MFITTRTYHRRCAMRNTLFDRVIFTCSLFPKARARAANKSHAHHTSPNEFCRYAGAVLKYGTVRPDTWCGSKLLQSFRPFRRRADRCRSGACCRTVGGVCRQLIKQVTRTSSRGKELNISWTTFRIASRHPPERRRRLIKSIIFHPICSARSCRSNYFSIFVRHAPTGDNMV